MAMHTNGNGGGDVSAVATEVFAVGVSFEPLTSFMDAVGCMVCLTGVAKAAITYGTCVVFYTGRFCSSILTPTI